LTILNYRRPRLRGYPPYGVHDTRPWSRGRPTIHGWRSALVCGASPSWTCSAGT